MGQRTQLVLKLKDRYGRVKTKVYHEQWGFGNTMPMLVINFLTDIHYGNQKEYLREYRKPNIVDLAELETMSKQDKASMLEQIDKTSIHNLQLSSYETTDEYEESNILLGTSTVFNRKTESYFSWTNYERLEVKLNKKDVENSAPLLSWDFDINNVNHIRTFRGDNNDGFCVISLEEVFNENFDVEIKTSVGFVISNYDDEDDPRKDNKINEVQDMRGYVSEYEDYYNEDLCKAFDVLCDKFDVEQLGNKVLTK